jgi:NAD-dependent SIR2 family protein deacetylase
MCRRSASTEYVLKAGVRQGSVVRCEHCKGLVKPDIVFFGEGLPDNFFELMVGSSRLPLRGIQFLSS